MIPFATRRLGVVDLHAVFSGAILDPFHPGPLALALARIHRFTGQSRAAISVAAHSVLAAQIARDLCPEDPDAAAALGLLHDAHEVITGDQGGPFSRYLATVAPAAADEIATAKRALDLQIFALYRLELSAATIHAGQAADALACALELEAGFGIAAAAPDPAQAEAVERGRYWLGEHLIRSGYAVDAITRDGDEYLRALAELERRGAIILPA